MKTLARYVLAVMLASAAVLHGSPASAEDYDGDDYRDSAPEPDDYHDALTPYGRWIDHAEYGRVWHPAAAVGWRPYSHGHWAWSPYGWTWISSEPWGWTFHYGRWSYAPVWGWVWVPGTVWGPAWVDWYWDDGYVGWAPLSPFGTHVTVVNHFVFVREHDFCAPRGRYIDHRRLPRRVHDRWRHRDWRDRGVGRGFRPPDRDRIERATGRPIPRFDGKPPQTVAPRRERRDDRVARPRHPDLGQARRGGWQRGGRNADEATGQRGGRRMDEATETRPRPGRHPDVARRDPRDPRDPRMSPPDPAPDFDAPRFARPDRRQREQRPVRGGSSARGYADPERPSGGLIRPNGGGHRRSAPPAIPGGDLVAPQHGGRGGTRGDGNGRAGGRGDFGGRGDGGGLGRGFQGAR